jgi:hypothetical protein
MHPSTPSLAFALLLVASCGSGGSPDAAPPVLDSGTPDAGTPDLDTGPPDSGAGDAGSAAMCNGDALPSGAGCDPGRCALQFSTTGVDIGCCPDGTGVQGAACDPTAQAALDRAGFVCDDCAIGFVCVDFVCHEVCDTRTNVCAGALTCTAIPGVPGAPDYGECE